MFDMFSILIFVFAFFALLAMISSMEEFKLLRFFLSVGCILFSIILYILVDNHDSPENYIISKKYIKTDVLHLNDGSRSYNFKFTDSLNIEVINYQIPLSQELDYANYIIYSDSINCDILLKIYSYKFDSLDYKLGKHIN